MLIYKDISFYNIFLREVKKFLQIYLLFEEWSSWHWIIQNFSITSKFTKVKKYSPPGSKNNLQCICTEQTGLQCWYFQSRVIIKEVCAHMCASTCVHIDIHIYVCLEVYFTVYTDNDFGATPVTMKVSEKYLRQRVLDSRPFTLTDITMLPAKWLSGNIFLYKASFVWLKLLH